MIPTAAPRRAIGRRSTFLALMCAQAAHSLEEYVFRLYDVFAPARAASAMFSDDPRTGFAIGNLLLVTFGFWCYFKRVRAAHPSADVWMWGWAALETANGLGHTAMAIDRGGYLPGVITAPALLAISVALGVRLARSSDD